MLRWVAAAGEPMDVAVRAWWCRVDLYSHCHQNLPICQERLQSGIPGVLKHLADFCEPVCANLYLQLGCTCLICDPCTSATAYAR